jgi:hypothetical protein
MLIEVNVSQILRSQRGREGEICEECLTLRPVDHATQEVVVQIWQK